MLGSQLLNAAQPQLLGGAGDACNVSSLVWRMGHGVLVQPLTNKMTPDQNTPRLSTPDANAPNVGYEVFSPCVAAAM